MATDWLDDFLEDIDTTAEVWQLDYIDQLLRSTSLSPEEVEFIERESLNYTQKEAAVKILYLKDNQVFTDPRDQWKFYSKNY